MRSLITKIIPAVVGLGSTYPESKNYRRWMVVLGLAGTLCSVLLLTRNVESALISSEDRGNHHSIHQRPGHQRIGQLPLSFIENRGQVDARVSYYLQGRDKTVYFTKQGVTLTLASEAPTSSFDRWNLKLDFVDPNPAAKIEAEGASGASISYFRGARKDWVTGLPSYSGIVYRDLWPGIDLHYAGTVDRMKYSFLVRAGADPSRIRLAYRGASRIGINETGELEVETPLGSYRDEAPVSYQPVSSEDALSATGSKREIRTAYRLEASPQGEGVVYGFELGDYDRTKDLLIDPAVLIYAGFLGGEGDDVAHDVATDEDGNAYIVGETSSTEMTFPETVGPDLTYNGNVRDAFICKVNDSGTDLIYCGYIGGAASDRAMGVAVDAAGNAYVVGETLSNQNTFPVLGGPDTTFNGSLDAFIAKVNATGTGLIYCGYIGGQFRDFGTKVAVDGSGNAYVVGYTESSDATFPVTVGPDLTYNGSIDAFIAKVNAAGNGLVYAGYIGGEDDDYARDVAVDGSGNAYVTGNTSSRMAFPVVGGPDPTYNGGLNDAYITKVNATGSEFVFSGYLGGSGSDTGHGIAVDSTGAVYVTGETTSNEGSFPVLGGPDLTFNGMTDAFVAKLDAAGAALVYSGYIGGAGIDRGFGIALNAQREAYVVGETSSFQSTFPVLGGPQLQINGAVDAFAAKISVSGTALIYNGYLGGVANDFALSVAVDDNGDAYVVGYTESNQDTFPESVGPDLTFNGGATDAFVAKVQMTPDVTPPLVAPVGAISLSQGASLDTTLAFVSDQDTLAGNIFVGVRGIPNGVTITNLNNNNGMVVATVAASCTVTPSSYQILIDATDGAGLRSTGEVTLNVAANQAPVLGLYPNIQIETGQMGVSTPSEAPRDNGTIAELTATAGENFTGTITINPMTGAVTIENAGPAGVYQVTVSATDNCGVVQERTFRLVVGTLAATVNAAGFTGTSISPESIVATFGSDLAETTEVASTVPLPTELAGTSVDVIDQTGTSRAAPLFFVSPGQVNFLVPAGTASGPALVIIRSGGGDVAFDEVVVESVAPGIFTANSAGSGVAAAFVLRVKEDGSRSMEPVARFDEEEMAWVPVPIDFGDPGDTLFLVLFGTGFRFSGGFEDTSVRVGTTDLEVLFSGATIDFVGLDQINSRLDRSLAGSGEVEVDVEIGGKQANTFTLAFR